MKKMSTIKIQVLLFILTFGFAAWALAEEVAKIVEPEKIDQVLGFLPAIVEAFKSGHYLMAGALVSLVVTFGIRQYVLPKLKVADGLLPLISAVVGMIAGVSLAVANQAPIGEAAMAVMSGPLASTLWSGALKYFFKKPISPV
jgi:hypothetical protein